MVIDMDNKTSKNFNKYLEKYLNNYLGRILTNGELNVIDVEISEVKEDTLRVWIKILEKGEEFLIFEDIKVKKRDKFEDKALVIYNQPEVIKEAIAMVTELIPKISER